MSIWLKVEMRFNQEDVHDFIDELLLIIHVAFFKKLLAEVVTAGGEAERFCPFQNGIDKHDHGFRVSREHETSLLSPLRVRLQYVRVRTVESSRLGH